MHTDDASVYEDGERCRRCMTRFVTAFTTRPSLEGGEVEWRDVKEGQGAYAKSYACWERNQK